jgi:LmbE family N-acetylglucosaminyl deacetylase
MSTNRIMVIGPHPDDVEIGAAGLIQHYQYRNIVLVTSGEVGGRESIREKEASNSAKILNADCYFLHQPDTKVQVVDLIPRLAKMINILQPDIICIPPIHDTHQDHRVVHEATLIATRSFQGTVLAYITPSSVIGFKPNWFISLTSEQFEKKITALKCHISQQDRSYTKEYYIHSIAEYWATINHTNQWVEPFELVRHWEL